MMGGKPKACKNPKAQVKFASWEPSDGEGYHSSNNEVVDGYWESSVGDNSDQDFP